MYSAYNPRRSLSVIVYTRTAGCLLTDKPLLGNQFKVCVGTLARRTGSKYLLMQLLMSGPQYLPKPFQISKLDFAGKHAKRPRHVDAVGELRYF